ncbi:MAG: hypothetical protein ACUVTD_04335 [Nitrososphaerales archaeon]
MIEINFAFQELLKVKVGRDKVAQRILNMALRRLPDNDSEPQDALGKIKRLLSYIVKRAKRQNVWRKFSSLGRNFINLCVSLPIKFRGESFLRALAKTLKELMLLLSPVYRFWFRGRELAYKICEVAYNFGNKDALNWRNDESFIVYWGMVLSSGYMGGERY